MIQQTPVDIYLSCDNDFDFPVVDSRTDILVSGASPTFVLKDSASATVSGSSGTASEISGKRGFYRATIPSTVSLTSGSTYYFEITTSSSGRDDFRRITCTARYRQLR